MKKRGLTIVADDKIPFLKGVFESCGCEVRYLPGGTICAEDVRDAQLLLTRTRTLCNEALLKDSAVQFIATATIGFDHIDTDYLNRRGIAWTNAPGCNSGSVMQYITLSLAALAHKHNITLEGKTLGVIGAGNVGSKVVKAGIALGMNVLVNDPPRSEKEKGEFHTLAEILAESDFVTVHTPLEKQGKYPTWHLANRDFFETMKPGSFFINSSRGAVCDNHALKEALQKYRIAGAILDVWENEPDIDLELLNLLDIATPHIAGYSADGKANGTKMSVRAAADFFDLEELKNFEPSGVPQPENPLISIEGKSLYEVLRQTYDIMQDYTNLRNAPEKFEYIRGSYPVRREFSAYQTDREYPLFCHLA